MGFSFNLKIVLFAVFLGKVLFFGRSCIIYSLIYYEGCCLSTNFCLQFPISKHVNALKGISKLKTQNFVIIIIILYPPFFHCFLRSSRLQCWTITTCLIMSYIMYLKNSCCRRWQVFFSLFYRLRRFRVWATSY